MPKTIPIFSTKRTNFFNCVNLLSHKLAVNSLSEWVQRMERSYYISLILKLEVDDGVTPKKTSRKLNETFTQVFSKTLKANTFDFL